MVAHEPTVLRSDDCILEGGGNVSEACPLEASPRQVDPEFVEDFPVPVQKDGLRGPVSLPDFP
jgi:hypothetical protein